MTDSKIMPKVSIVIPVYNGSNYLKNAIDCALSQTYENIEVIVVNDGSADDGETAKIASSYGDNINYIEKENGGVSSALNLGISRMSGEYFSWLSHDDEYTPTKVADSIEALRKNGCLDEKTIAYSAHSLIDKNSQTVKVYSDVFTPNRVYTSKEMIRYCSSHQALNGCCMLIPKRILDKSGCFNEELRYAQDVLLWFNLFFNGAGLVYDDRVNVGYRLHPGQTSRTKRELFDHDISYIAGSIAGGLIDADNGNELVYSYAKRIAIYEAKNAVKTLENAAADAGYPFTAKQKININRICLYGKLRAKLKKIYYGIVLKVKV